MGKPASDVLGAVCEDIGCAVQDQCGPSGARCSVGARPDVPVRSPGPGAPGGRAADWKGRLVLSDPALVGEETPDRVVLVVAQTTGCQFDVSCGHGWHPDGVVGELAVDRADPVPGPRPAPELARYDRIIAGYEGEPPVAATGTGTRDALVVLARVLDRDGQQLSACQLG
jgi:hypothetical protein